MFLKSACFPMGVKVALYVIFIDFTGRYLEEHLPMTNLLCVLNMSSRHLGYKILRKKLHSPNSIYCSKRAREQGSLLDSRAGW